LTVNISSSDPTRVLLSPDPSVLGQGTISVSIPQGSTSLLSGFYVQGLASSGTVQLTVSAPGYSSAVSTTTLTPSGFVLAAPPSNFSTSTLSQNTAITILPVQLNSSLAIISGVTARIRGGFSVNVPITSANTNAGDIANSPSVFVGGDTVGTAASFHPKAAGSTQISVGTPSGFSTPTTSTSVLATVTQPNITLSPVTVGANLQAPGTGVLQVAAPTGGLNVTLTSSDPTKVKLTANAAVDGSGSITLSVPAGTTLLPPFYVQGLASSGTFQVTATATGYANATGQVGLAPSGFVLTGPNNAAGQPFSTTTISPPSNITVTVMQLNANLTPFQEGTLRGGISVSVPVTSSSTGVGTISSSPVTLNAGATNATTQFQPVTSGTATLSLGAPSIAGFSTPSSQIQVLATVSAPSISLNLASSNIGNNLQVLGSGSLTAPAPSSGLQVTITSNSPDVLVSNDSSGATAGAASTIVFVPGGSGLNGRGFPLFYVQALNSTGSAQLTVSAPGWDSTSITVALKPSGFTLSGSTQGIGQDFAIQTAQTTLLPVQAWQLNSSTLNPQNAQSVRGGLTVQVGVSSSNTGVGTVVDTPAVFNGGTGLIELTFQSNNSPGTTTVLTLTEPAGFATPVFGGQSATQLTAHVN
jgi:hypothetical protein